MSVAAYPELISDDPRVEVPSSGVIDELREFYAASKALRGLLTKSQAARIIGVSTSTIKNMADTGRLSSATISGVRMVSAAEVLAYHLERTGPKPQSLGRGYKGSVLAPLAKDAWQDLLEK